MEKNIAAHDLSDMMVFEGMEKQSRKIYLQQALGIFKKTADVCVRFVQKSVSLIKHLFVSKRLTLVNVDEVFTDTKKAVYAIAIVSGAISFFWFVLLISA